MLDFYDLPEKSFFQHKLMSDIQSLQTCCSKISLGNIDNKHYHYNLITKFHCRTNVLISVVLHATIKKEEGVFQTNYICFVQQYWTALKICSTVTRASGNITVDILAFVYLKFIQVQNIIIDDEVKISISIWCNNGTSVEYACFALRESIHIPLDMI